MQTSFPSYGEIFDAINEKSTTYFNFFRDFIGNDKNVVELGSGTGRLLIPLAQHAQSIMGIDNCEDALNISRNKAKALSYCGHIEFQYADMLEAIIPSTTDVVYFSCDTLTMISEVGDRYRLFEKLSCDLDTGARVLIALNNPHALWLSETQQYDRSGPCRDGRVRVAEKRLVNSSMATRHCTKTTIFYPKESDSLPETTSQHRKLAIVTLAEIKMLCHSHGFRINKTFGNYQAEIYCQNSQKLIVELVK